MIDKYAVVGNPVAHSKSPFIHSQFAKQTQQPIQYTAIEVPLDQFPQFIKKFQLEGLKGLNITVPFKQEAFALVTICSERAKIARAVNTIKFLETGEILGDNTDGIGFIRDLTDHYHVGLAGKRILIIGAGGAVRGILYPLLQQHPELIIVANRTLATAETLAQEFKQWGNIAASSLDTIEGNFDLIIHGTSAGLQNETILLTPKILKQSTFCYDLIYSQSLTPFLKWAKDNGVNKFADGTGMLVEQAAESFYIWRHVKPETKNVIALLKHL